MFLFRLLKRNGQGFYIGTYTSYMGFHVGSIIGTYVSIFSKNDIVFQIILNIHCDSIKNI